MTVLFTATEDVSALANADFQDKLSHFLVRELGDSVIPESVELDGSVDTEPGDPCDLM